MAYLEWVQFLTPINLNLKKFSWQCTIYAKIPHYWWCVSRLLSIVLVKVALYATSSARFLSKLCSNYASLQKLC